jgi:hypothetical protein
VSAALHLPRRIVEETFGCFRECGVGRDECQVLWIGPWASPDRITEAVHPKHRSHRGGFVLDGGWISDFWQRLADEGLGIRAQVHTHPTVAFHSDTDDAYPIIHAPGFLSLVIPNFAFGPVGFENAYLTEIQSDGSWREVSIAERLEVE